MFVSLSLSDSALHAAYHLQELSSSLVTNGVWALSFHQRHQKPMTEQPWWGRRVLTAPAFHFVDFFCFYLFAKVSRLKERTSCAKRDFYYSPLSDPHVTEVFVVMQHKRSVRVTDSSKSLGDQLMTLLFAQITCCPFEGISITCKLEGNA